MKRKKSKSLILSRIVLFVIVLYLLTLVYQTSKPLPEGIDYQSNGYLIKSEDVKFLHDLTYKNANGTIVHEQEIFKTVYSMIDNAEEHIILDMFLYNPFSGKTTQDLPRLSGNLTTKLISRSERDITLVTDPINIVYFGSTQEQFDRLKENGVNVIITDLTKLRDSNPYYSAVWRMFFQWFGNSVGGILPHPFSNQMPDVSIRSYLTMLNFKANHRKLITTVIDGEKAGLVASANPHDASGWHSNVALKFNGDVVKEIEYSERAIAEMSGLEQNNYPDPQNVDFGSGDCEISFITEQRIHDSIIEAIRETVKGESIDLAMFYLSDRHVVKELLNAASRGVNVRIILDPNKDAFGFEKNGIPNRQVANELVKKSNGKIQVRWYSTHGEQFHTKMIVITKNDGRRVVIMGSANFTRRNLHNLNLEADIHLETSPDSAINEEFSVYFERIWSNSDGNEYTLDYSSYSDDSFWKYWVYRFQEAYGLSSF